MSDPQATTAPIAVRTDPNREQAQAALRQVLLAVGAIVSAFGLAKTAGVLGVLANLTDPLVTVAFAAVGLWALVAGQLRTRSNAKKSAALVDHIDDPSVAVRK